MLLPFLFSCVEPKPPEVEIKSRGVRVSHELGISEIRLVDSSGNPILEQVYPIALETLEIDYVWTESASFELNLLGPSGQWKLPLPIQLNALGFEVYGGVAGQQQNQLSAQDPIPVAMIGDVGLQWLFRVEAWDAGELLIRTETSEVVKTVDAGDSVLSWHKIIPGTAQAVDVCLKQKCETYHIEPVRLSIVEAQDVLSVESWVLPANASGEVDAVLPPEQIWLPAKWWQRVLSKFGLGFRARDPWAPIAFEAVRLRNNSDSPTSVVIDSRIVDSQGTPATIFRPRIREGSSPEGYRRALLTIPAQQTARAVLPLYFDSTQFNSDQAEWTRELKVSALGHNTSLHEINRSLVVQRTEGWVSIGFVCSLLATVSGLILVLVNGRKWVRFPSSTLTTIAMFAALESVTRLVVRVAGLGAAAVLGPFSIFVTALPDQIVRFSILGALIGLLPRVGVPSLMIGVGWLLGGVLSGSLNVVGFLTVLGEIFWIESMLWICGVTRRREGAMGSPVRFFTAIVLFSVLSSACGYALHMVLYRLFYHPAYLGTVLIGPACLYVAIAAVVARQLMGSLARVQR